jgi:hypothetical protein
MHENFPYLEFRPMFILNKGSPGGGGKVWRIRNMSTKSMLTHIWKIK